MTDVILIVLLVIANGFFSGAEIAVVASRQSRLQELADEGSKGARAVLGLRGDPERFLATVQIGITLVSATAAAFGGASIAEQLAPVLATLPGIGAHAGVAALTLVVVAISYLSIVVGELVPKSLALRGAESYALWIGRPLLALSWLARPVVWLLSGSANLLLRPFGDRTTFSETHHTAEELQQMVDQAARAGTIHPEAGQIASRALELPELTVSEVMIPRQQVVMVPRHASLDALQRLLLTQPHSRLPVYEGKIDNVVGYVAVRDLLRQALEQRPIDVEQALRPATFVPESKFAVELLREMRERHQALAIVVDEQGGTAGIVTMEDLVEELVGDIFSENAAPPPQQIIVENDGSALVNGTTPIREVNRALGIELPDDGDWTTLAGLCLALAGTIPASGRVLSLPPSITLEIVDATPRRVRMVRVRSAAPVTAGPQQT